MASTPIAITEPASNVSASGAVLHGHVDPAGGPPIFKCYFEYGVDTSYGGMVPCSPGPEPPFTAATSVAWELGGLQSDTTYHYRVVAVVEPLEDQFTFGADQTFCTGASCSSKPPTVGVAPKCTPQEQPRVAVILMEGVDSVSPKDTYDPGRVSSYCYTGAGGVKTKFPPSLQPLMDNFNPAYDPNSPGGSVSMTDTLAAHGGVTFLPWSFKGVWISPTGVPYVHVNASTAQDADQLPVDTDAATLAQEVASVHKAWPHARIVILAHSHGGLIAEQYWEYYWRAQHNGVTRIIALDAPINGVKLAGDCAFPGSGSLAALCANFSSDVYNFYKSLWLSIEWHDPAISANDQDGIFLPVGTEGDFAYDAANYGSDTLLSQLLFQCGGWPIETCNPLSPAFVSPCPSQSHQEVKACPGVIDYVDKAVWGSVAPSASRVQPMSSATISSTATASVSRRPRDPLRRLVAGRPWAQPAPPAVTPGGPLTLNGMHLGGSPGVLEFSAASAGIANAPILNWGDTSIETRVPANAVSGPVFLFDATGEAVPVGSVAVLAGPIGVDRLLAPAHLHARGTARLTVTALIGGRAAKGRIVSLFDGYRERTSRTDGRGQAVFVLKGSGTQSYVAHSGRAWLSVLVSRPPLPSYMFRVRATPKRPRTGKRIEVTVGVRGPAGRPALSVPVTLSVQGPRGLVLPIRHIRTDRRGRIVLRFRQPAGGPAIVTVTAGASSADFVSQ